MFLDSACRRFDGLPGPGLLREYSVSGRRALPGVAGPDGDSAAQTAAVHHRVLLRPYAFPRRGQLRAKLRDAVQLQPEVSQRC